MISLSIEDLNSIIYIYIYIYMRYIKKHNKHYIAFNYSLEKSTLPKL